MSQQQRRYLLPITMHISLSRSLPIFFDCALPARNLQIPSFSNESTGSRSYILSKLSIALHLALGDERGRARQKSSVRCTDTISKLSFVAVVSFVVIYIYTSFVWWPLYILGKESEKDAPPEKSERSSRHIVPTPCAASARAHIVGASRVPAFPPFSVCVYICVYHERLSVSLRSPPRLRYRYGVQEPLWCV